MTLTPPVFDDRPAAGAALAGLLAHLKGRDVRVCALPRGGAPVAWVVAQRLRVPLGVCVTCKLRVGEAVVGAVSEAGAVWLDDRALRHAGLEPEGLTASIASATLDVERLARIYRSREAPSAIAGHTVLLVDDGLVTAAPALAALRALKEQGAKQVIVAAPIGEREAVEAVRLVADAVVVPHVIEELGELSRWYRALGAVTDGEVIALLSAPDPNEEALDAAVP
ncbi:MAG: phosphoribosyltransferase [Archangiaceae bacterium]|nr:phosphoribosyltransferase [Archangiaceae bacterium]